jgi:kinesin family protein 5
MEPEREFFRSFGFDKVFEPSDSQEYVYNTIGYPVVQDILRGINGTIMAYGQTGTGKTYTMGILGSFDEVNMGLVPRCLDDIFYLLEKEKQQNNDLEWTCNLSFLQIYMEMV